MVLVTAEQRDELFSTFKKDAFHLELQDEYRVSIEDGPYAKWRKGEPDDFAWFRPWLDQTHTLTAAGKSIRRVRIVTEPVSEYIRWELELTPMNHEAGEEIRWLPRQHIQDGFNFPASGNDWWLFDGETLAVTHFRPDGRFEGAEIITDPTMVEHAVRVRDQLWSLAIPYNEYTS
ncbi:hypothetical protein QZH56_04975 [Streptomyces olivoreticuli]|uniref:DUF6879 family protein n=1 Tax=Streptomyces olivoreticuli TaxID=68246 RepID=UPI00265B4DF5|nr:DUF6879 family protein [Streptomyces olivoreticuli]WKK24977.1 hypothetical protein QZH56_04975 [Streptomyces olivoreticuli]